MEEGHQRLGHAGGQVGLAPSTHHVNDLALTVGKHETIQNPYSPHEIATCIIFFPGQGSLFLRASAIVIASM